MVPTEREQHRRDRLQHQGALNLDPPCRALADDEAGKPLRTLRAHDQCPRAGTRRFHREIERLAEGLLVTPEATVQLIHSEEQLGELLVHAEPDQHGGEYQKVAATDDEALQLKDLAAGEVDPAAMKSTTSAVAVSAVSRQLQRITAESSGRMKNRKNGLV